MFCTECGAEVQSGAKFCGKCGTAISLKEQKENNDLNQKDQQNKSAPSSTGLNKEEKYDPGLAASRGVKTKSPAPKGYDPGLERSRRPESKELVFRAGIFFSGKGLLAIAIPAGYYCLFAIIGNIVDSSFFELSPGFVTFLGVIAIIASAYTTWKIGKKLNRKKEAMHTLYFMPLEKWAFIQIIVFIAYFIFR